MTKLDVYECNRCGKEFKKEQGKLPSNLVIEDNSFNMVVVKKDLCIDCISSLWAWFEYNEEIDKLVNELSRKETGE